MFDKKRCSRSPAVGYFSPIDTKFETEGGTKFVGPVLQFCNSESPALSAVILKTLHVGLLSVELQNFTPAPSPSSSKTFFKLDNGFLREGTYKDIAALLWTPTGSW